MLRKTHDKQQEMEIVILEQMIPQNHLLRKIDRGIDFSFIHKLCEPLYCEDNGRPAIDPEVLFRKKDDRDDPPTMTIQQSRTDPESGQLHKEGKPDGFHYSEHRTVDSKRNIVVNVRVTPANVNDVDPVPDIINDVEKRLGTCQNIWA